jgi:hypothetical protein
VGGVKWGTRRRLKKWFKIRSIAGGVVLMQPERSLLFKLRTIK